MQPAETPVTNRHIMGGNKYDVIWWDKDYDEVKEAVNQDVLSGCGHPSLWTVRGTLWGKYAQPNASFHFMFFFLTEQQRVTRTAGEKGARNWVKTHHFWWMAVYLYMLPHPCCILYIQEERKREREREEKNIQRKKGITADCTYNWPQC